MNFWREMRLGDFVTLQRGHDLTEQERRPGNVPVVGSAGIHGYHDTAKADGLGVTVGRSGASFGVVTYCPQNFWPHNTALYVIDFHGNDRRFAYYLLKTLNFSCFNSGSAQPSLNRNFIHPMPVRVPSLPVQHAVAAVLGAFDDKIDCNRRINDLLLRMAQALYQHWFVDFGPFQKRGLQDSDIGPIPKDSHAGRFGDVALTVRSPADPQSLPPGTPYIGLEHMPRGGIAADHWGTADEVNSNKWSFKAGQILFGKLRPYFKKVGVAAVDGVCSTDILVIEPARPVFFSLVACQASNEDFIKFADAGSGGTKMPRTSWERLASYPMAIPPQPVAQTFNDEVSPLIELILAHIHESHRLAEIRDYLLPKLLSGEVEVKEVEGVA